MNMKFLIIFLLILQFPLGVLAQGGNLQFNRVLNFTSGANYTVPQGKALKIESLNTSILATFRIGKVGCDTFSYPGLCYYSLGYGYEAPVQIGSIKLNSGQSAFSNINTNGHLVYNIGQLTYGCTTCPNHVDYVLSIPSHNITMPIWLSEGELVKIINYQSALPGLSPYSGIHISAIEFNVVP